MTPSDDRPTLEDLQACNRDLAWIAGLSLCALLAAFVFLAAPQIDLYVAGLFFDPESNRFPLGKAAIPLWFNELIDNLSVVSIVFVLAGLGYTLIRGGRMAGFGRRAYAFLFASLLIAPGLIVNVLLKSEWGRARPRDITQFGGTLDFSPPLVMVDQCARNCSFVSGDAALGFTMLALALLIPVARRRFVIAAIGFGVFISGIRVVQGAHFFSDVIYSGLIVCLIIILLKMIILDGRWGIADRVARLADRGREGAAEVRTGLLLPAEPLVRQAGDSLLARLGLVHGSAARDWRRDAFARLDAGTVRRRLWLFFRAGPRDFGMDDPGR